jgi:hypothetical protein
LRFSFGEKTRLELACQGLDLRAALNQLEHRLIDQANQPIRLKRSPTQRL